MDSEYSDMHTFQQMALQLLTRYVSKQQVKIYLATEPSFTTVQKEKKSRIRYTKYVTFCNVFRYRILLFTKQCCNNAFSFITKLQNTHTLYNTTIYWI